MGRSRWTIWPSKAERWCEVEAGHPGYLKLLDEMRELHCRKAADYGRGADPLANCRGSTEFGVPAWVGTMIRAMDKVHRIKSFIQNGSLKNESVEDSFKDLAAYALIALCLYREDTKDPRQPAPDIRPVDRTWVDAEKADGERFKGILSGPVGQNLGGHGLKLHRGD